MSKLTTVEDLMKAVELSVASTWAGLTPETQTGTTMAADITELRKALISMATTMAERPTITNATTPSQTTMTNVTTCHTAKVPTANRPMTINMVLPENTVQHANKVNTRTLTDNTNVARHRPCMAAADWAGADEDVADDAH